MGGESRGAGMLKKMRFGTILRIETIVALSVR